MNGVHESFSKTDDSISAMTGAARTTLAALSAPSFPIIVTYA